MGLPQVGEHYLSEKWGQRLMTLQRFVERYVLQPPPPPPPQQQQPSALQVECGGGADSDQEEAQGQQAQPQGRQGQQGQQRGYLAQHPLFDQIPALAADIREPAYCSLGEEGRVRSVNAWFGPAGTVSSSSAAALQCAGVGCRGYACG